MCIAWKMPKERSDNSRAGQSGDLRDVREARTAMYRLCKYATASVTASSGGSRSRGKWNH